MSRSRPTLIPLLALALSLAPALAPAHAADPDDPTTRINFAHAADLGLGTFSVEGRSVQIYRIPLSYTLRPVRDGRWGVKLTFPVSFGLHDFKIGDIGEGDIIESLDTVSVVPGVEFQLPLRQHWMLKPYAELGGGQDLSSGGYALIYAAGLKSLATFPRGGFELGFGSALKLSGSRTTDGALIDNLASVEVGLDARHPLGFSIGQHRADFSVYATVRHFLDELEFPGFQGGPVGVRNLYEVGVTFGSEPQLEIWGIPLSRLGVSYRFGDGLRAWRINFGFPF